MSSIYLYSISDIMDTILLYKKKLKGSKFCYRRICYLYCHCHLCC